MVDIELNIGVGLFFFFEGLGGVVDGWVGVQDWCREYTFCLLFVYLGCGGGGRG